MWNPFKTKKVPEIGSVWESKDDNPFLRHQVTVKEISEGYVKFRGVGLYMSYTAPVDKFLSAFREVDKENS